MIQIKARQKIKKGSKILCKYNFSKMLRTRKTNKKHFNESVVRAFRNCLCRKCFGQNCVQFFFFAATNGNQNTHHICIHKLQNTCSGSEAKRGQHQFLFSVFNFYIWTMKCSSVAISIHPALRAHPFSSKTQFFIWQLAIISSNAFRRHLEAIQIEF